MGSQSGRCSRLREQGASGARRSRARAAVARADSPACRALIRNAAPAPEERGYCLAGVRPHQAGPGDGRGPRLADERIPDGDSGGRHAAECRDHERHAPRVAGVIGGGRRTAAVRSRTRGAAAAHDSTRTVITPRIIRLLRVPDLQTLHETIARLSIAGYGTGEAEPRISDAGQPVTADPLAARGCAVLVPTRGAAEALRRTLENRLVATPGAIAAVPAILTRGDLYQRFHQHAADAPPLLSEFEREVLVRRAARHASQSGTPAPFRLRSGLILEILSLYDELRRGGRTVEDFERHMIGS